MMILTGASRRRRIRTGFEATGQLTTLEYEAEFWSALDTRTDVTAAVAGQSVEGRDIWQASIGDGTDRTVLIGCLRHGYEKSPRDGAMALMRDLAYATDTATLDYLATHRVAVFPTQNPDAFVREGTVEGAKGDNADGIDLQEVLRMYAVENHTFAAVWADYAPSVFVDMHTQGGPPGTRLTGRTFLGLSTTVPAAHPDLNTLALAMSQAMVDAVIASGLEAEQRQTTGDAGPGSAAAYGALNHAVSRTTETEAALPHDIQVAATRAALGGLIDWHATHGAAAAAARAASIQALLDAEVVPSFQDSHGVWQAVPGLIGYEMTGYFRPAHIEISGIEPAVNGFVTLAQPAGRILPHLLDPSSRHKGNTVGATTRVMSP